MPADYEDFHSVYDEHIDEIGIERGSFDSWLDIFESTGIAYVDADLEERAFSDFLDAFYPNAEISPGEWIERREAFYDEYNTDPADIDWDAWREAMGYD